MRLYSISWACRFRRRALLCDLTIDCGRLSSSPDLGLTPGRLFFSCEIALNADTRRLAPPVAVVSCRADALWRLGHKSVVCAGIGVLLRRPRVVLVHAGDVGAAQAPAYFIYSPGYDVADAILETAATHAVDTLLLGATWRGVLWRAMKAEVIQQVAA